MFRDEYKQGLSLDVSLKVIQFKTESLLKEEGNQQVKKGQEVPKVPKILKQTRSKNKVMPKKERGNLFEIKVQVHLMIVTIKIME